MEAVNPYQSPDAILDEDNKTYYQPKILSHEGRLGRVRYICYSYFLSIVLMAGMFAIAAVFNLFGESSDGDFANSAAFGMMYIPIIIVSLVASKRRLNDTNHSGWLSLLMLVPFVNALMGLYLMFAPGTSGENEFGLPPVENSPGLKIAAVLFVVVFVGGIAAAVILPAIAS